MVGRNEINFRLSLDSKDAQRGLKEAAADAGDLSEELDEVESAGQAMARAIEQSADDMIAEIDRTKRAVDAMDEAFGDADYDSRKVVADLKKVGLTAEDIEADAEALADALRRTEDIKLRATAQGFDDVEQAVGRVGDQTERTRDVASGFTGGMIGELPVVADALGPVGEGFGQLAEGALDGQISMKQLIGTAAGFGAVAFGIQQINNKLERMREIDALRDEQVRDYADALRDADNALEAMVGHFSDVEEFTFDNFKLGGDEVREGLLQLGLNAETMAGLVENGQEAIDGWAEAARDAGASSDDVTIAQKILEDQLKITTEGAELHAVAMQFAKRETDIYNTSIDNAARKSQTLEYWSKRGAGGIGEVEDAAGDAAVSVDDLTTALSGFQKALDIETALETFKTDVFNAFAEAESDVLTSEESVRTYEQAVIDAAREIDNIPPEVVTELLAMTDDGLTAAEAQKASDVFSRWSATNPATIFARIQTLASQGVTTRDMVLGNIPAGAGSTSGPSGTGGGSFQSRGGGTTQGRGGGINIVVNAGVGTDGARVGREVVEAIKRYERANGSGWRS